MSGLCILREQKEAKKLFRLVQDVVRLQTCVGNVGIGSCIGDLYWTLCALGS